MGGFAIIAGMLSVQTLASGSKGNCTYVTSGETSILVDIGLTLPTMLKRLAVAGIKPESIDAVLVTHEHSDHIGGVAKFCARFGTKLYVYEGAGQCFLECAKGMPMELVKTFDEPFMIGDIEVDFFKVPHDSCYCFGYTFSKGEHKFAMATDLGSMRDEIYDKMQGSQIVLIESNYDTAKLALNRKYPEWLKRRIASRTGHLSNTSAGVAAARLFSQGTRQIILAHLSDENNSPMLARRVVGDFLEKNNIKMQIEIAHQNEVSQLHRVDIATKI